MAHQVARFGSNSRLQDQHWIHLETAESLPSCLPKQAVLGKSYGFQVGWAKRRFGFLWNLPFLLLTFFWTSEIWCVEPVNHEILLWEAGESDNEWTSSKNRIRCPWHDATRAVPVAPQPGGGLDDSHSWVAMGRGTNEDQKVGEAIRITRKTLDTCCALWVYSECSSASAFLLWAIYVQLSDGSGFLFPCVLKWHPMSFPEK